MALYIIGDIQGCHDCLQRLLGQVDYDPGLDHLWFVGDLVNRGPNSLETLRFIKSLPNCISVLGNHDLHLLAVAYGDAECIKGDTLDEILDAPDREELLQWLRHRPLLHYDKARQICLIHAGLAPEWTLELAIACANEVQDVLRSDGFSDYFAHMYGDNPRRWKNDLSGWERLRFITNCFTRLRYVDQNGELVLKLKGPLDKKPDNVQAWFRVDNRQSLHNKIVFGHWSTLGLHESDNILALDSGCLWGGALSAARFDQQGNYEGFTQIPCETSQKPSMFS
jgi:bis(5'-nucleosyl)-tetraphosphatase (symmetrical)